MSGVSAGSFVGLRGYPEVLGDSKVTKKVKATHEPTSRDDFKFKFSKLSRVNKIKNVSFFMS